MTEQNVAASDGGQLALYSYGSDDAPGERRVVVVGGAFLTALIYRPFALALAKELGEGWGVDVFDRRGRGNSTPQPDDYSMATEISDVRTVLEVTGARNIFGHSLGGAVVLNAVQEFVGSAHEPAKLAVYDAAVNIDGSIDTRWIAGFEAAVNAGQIGRALARMKRGMQHGTALARVPEPVLAGLMALMSRTKVNKVLTVLMPSAAGELKAAYDESDEVRDFSVLPSNTHFMVGGRSPAYYRETASRLHSAVKGSTLQTSPKGVHGSIPAAFKELISDIADYYRG